MSRLVPLIIHERIAYWARHVKPRTAGWLVRVIESRSREDLLAAVAGAACPILVLEVGARPRAVLEDLDAVMRACPSALSLLVCDHELSGVESLARELGAVHVCPATMPPPAVCELLGRWVALARRRMEADGWSRDPRAAVDDDPLMTLVPSSRGN